MKDIVVAIDFSKGSIHALEYAIDLANLIKTNVIMVWVESIDNNEGVFFKESKEFRSETKDNFEELLSKYKSTLLHGKLTAKIRKGKVYQEFSNFVKQNDCSMLIVGAHGSSGFEEYWIGTNAFRIVSSSMSPVVTVKNSYDLKRGFRNILLPVNHSVQTLHKVAYTADVARATGADISILALNSGGLKSMQRNVDSNVLKVTSLLNEKGINYTVDSISSENIAADILEYAKKVDADLISIMTDVQDQANSILLGAFAQQVMNFSPIPVLSIHPKNSISLF